MSIPDCSAETSAAKPRVQSVARAFEVVQFVAAHDGPGVRPKELASALDLSRQVVYHLVHTLVSAGVLRKAGGSRYVLGLAVAPIAQGFRRQLACADHFVKYASEAASLTGETAYVGGWIDGEIVARAAAPGSLTVRANEIPLGTAGHAHARGSGKLLLAMCSETATEDYLRRHPLVPRTRNTITTGKHLRRELANIRAAQMALDVEEYSEGLCCVAVPLGQGADQAALSISAPTERLFKNLPRYVELLREVVSRDRV